MSKRLLEKSTKRQETNKKSSAAPILNKLPLFLSGHPLYLVSFLQDKGYTPIVLFNNDTPLLLRNKQVTVILSLFDLSIIEDTLKNLHRKRIRLVVFSSLKELNILNRVSIGKEVFYFKKKDIPSFEPVFVNIDVIKNVIKCLPVVGEAGDSNTLENEVSILKNLLGV